MAGNAVLADEPGQRVDPPTPGDLRVRAQRELRVALQDADVADDGWVKKDLAQAGERVEGLVIAREADESIEYALSAVPDVRLQLYEVEFRLNEWK